MKKLILACMLFVPYWVSTAVQSSDGITQTATPVASEVTLSNTHSQWVNCNVGDCNINLPGRVTIRYGSDGNFFYTVVENLSQVGCVDATMGDPNITHEKTCAYTDAPVLAVPASSTFKKIVDGGKTFRLSHNGYYWVRFGNDGHWVYTVLEGGNKQLFYCTDDYFRIDPLSGKAKQCQVGSSFTQGTSNMRSCSDQHSNCDVGTQRTVLLRYGTDERAYHRFGRIGKGTILCHDNVFLDPHPGLRKRCDYQTMDPASIETEGKWVKAMSCAGRGCPISQSIEVGTTRSDSWSTGKEWSTGVSVSVESGFKVFGVGGTATVEVSSSYAHSKSFTNSAESTQTQAYTATCDPDSQYDRRSLWRFSTEVEQSCFENGECIGTILTPEYACIGNEPTGYVGPSCIPGYCDLDKDPFCQVCTYDE